MLLVLLSLSCLVAAPCDAAAARCLLPWEEEDKGIMFLLLLLCILAGLLASFFSSFLRLFPFPLFSSLHCFPAPFVVVVSHTQIMSQLERVNDDDDDNDNALFRRNE